VSAGAEELTEAVEFALAKWGDLRQHNKARAADAHFHTWLFETIPADFEILRGQPGHDPDSAHAFLAFEIVSALFERDQPADAFLVLGWLGKYFVNHPNADAATRAVMALTDHCTQAGTAGPENNASARRALRASTGHPRRTGTVPGTGGYCQPARLLDRAGGCLPPGRGTLGAVDGGHHPLAAQHRPAPARLGLPCPDEQSLPLAAIRP
jgi:hypothetical protein